MAYNIFEDQELIRKIKVKLPDLFSIAEVESSRAGRIGMEVGSVRERIIIALLIYKYGEENVETNLPIHEREIDVIVNNKPLSIKTISGKNLGGFKLIWTVDREKVIEFYKSYIPTCDTLIAHINWEGSGGLYLFSKESQEEVFNAIGREQYIKLPKPGTNPRGVEISRKATMLLRDNPKCRAIPIQWNRRKIKFDLYSRWLKLWEQD